MKSNVEIRSYCRTFREPLRTAHGLWTERRGFLIRITGEDGEHGYGEVAPTPWLGSETLEEAADFLRAFASRAGKGSRNLGAISQLPACRFGIDSAMAELRQTAVDLPIRPIEVAALLPPGSAGLDALERGFQAGYRTFKWKIGVESAELERGIFRELRASAPPAAQFRLDANGGLSPDDAREWLKLLEETEIQYLEQPLPPENFAEMKTLATEFRTPIALDESIGNARQFEAVHNRGWKGLYVVKPALFGAMREGVALLPALRPRLIFSSAFETSIGFEAVLRWASRWQADGVAAGLGTGGFLEDDKLFIHPPGPKIIRGLIDSARVWEAAGKG
ncbi:MAG: o-succinylbenzoate synthase [Opitutales bacterium]